MRYLSFLLILLTGCASYRALPLSYPEVHCMQAQPKLPLTMMAKAFDKRDCQAYLDRDVIKEGYQPVQLFVQNNSPHHYLFTLNRVGIPVARSDQVAELVHTSTVGRVVGYSAAAVCTCGLFVIPAVVDGIKSAEANAQLDFDYFVKAAKDQIIPPFTCLNTLLFVPLPHFRPFFNVTLVEQETGELKGFAVQVR
jgi:hypothetical protein